MIPPASRQALTLPERFGRSLALGLLVMILWGCSGSPLPEAGTRLAAHPSVDVPEWAKDAIWYQIFPERFRNGDRSNDPRVEDLVGSWPHLSPEGWAIAPWTSDWYAQPEWEQQFPFYTGVQLRRYGGDLEGVRQALPYLDSLGVTAIYLNPVFESPSLHKYDGETFHHVEDNFGPNPVEDRRLVSLENPLDPGSWNWTTADRLFLRVVEEAHERGIRVILDGVFNHMGLKSFAFQDLLINQQQSTYADWFYVDSWDDPTTPDTSEFSYQGWVGVKELPELKEDADGLIAPIRDYVFAATARWMDPNGDGDPSDGIDGWRLDVAEMVDLDFWRLFRTHARAINPDAYLVGEIWWDEWPESMLNGAPWLQGDAFDAVMNYRWATATRRLFLGSDLQPGQQYGPAEFLAELALLRSQYPADASRVLMNTMGSHDTARLSSQIVNPEFQFDNRTSIKDSPAYRIRKPGEAEMATMRMMLAHQFTYIGAPHVYYGDEAGMWGGDDPDERKPMVWPGVAYSNEISHPFGGERPDDPVAFDHDLFEYYRTLTALRHRRSSLARGHFRPLEASHDRVLAYERGLGVERVWVVFNLDDQPVDATIFIQTVITEPGHSDDIDISMLSATDALSDRTVTLDRGELRISLASRSVAILELDN